MGGIYEPSLAVTLTISTNILIFYHLEPSCVTTPNHKGGWEMFSYMHRRTQGYLGGSVGWMSDS